MCRGKVLLSVEHRESLNESITDETHYQPSTDGEICDHMIEEKDKQFVGK